MVASGELHRPVLDFASQDFPVLGADQTLGEAVERIRAHGLRDKIIYFYVTDADGRLVGVLPGRRFLTDSLQTLVGDAMMRRVVAIPTRATMLEACEFFVLHKLLAFPVVDESRRLVGVIDVSVFAEEVLDFAEKEQMDDLFQSLGFRVSELQTASSLQAFKLRFPWLLATVTGGIACAFLAGAYAETLEQRIVFAFFLTLVLGLGESVSAQSVAVTLQALHRSKPSLAWLMRSVRKELATAVLLGGACGLLVGVLVAVWRSDLLAACSIGLSILLAMTVACLLGVLVPATSRALRLDPRIAAGPLTLALADVATLSIYFALASTMLGVFR